MLSFQRSRNFWSGNMVWLSYAPLRCLWMQKRQTTHPPAFRAACLQELYLNDRIKAIFDLSGGDLANEILPYLDFESIKVHPKPYFGYSDNTVIVNALQRRTGIRNYLYNPKVLVSSEAAVSKSRMRCDAWFRSSGHVGLSGAGWSSGLRAAERCLLCGRKHPLLVEIGRNRVLAGFPE